MYICRMSQPTRILIIRFSSMGDIVLTTPVIRRLKQQLEGEVEIHYLTKKAFVPLLEHNPFIHRIHAMDKTVQENIPDLLEIPFDYIIDLHQNIRSRVVKRKLEKLTFTFKKLNFEKWLLVNLGINRMPDVHVVDRYLDTIAAFGTEDDGKGLDYFLPENINLPSELPTRFIAFAIGGAHIGKRMDAAKLIDIIQQLSLPVVLLGGKEDVGIADEIKVALPNVIQWAGVLNIHQSAQVTKQAHVVVSGDTGLMHIASAFGKNIVSLWGCTSPQLGMYPYRAGVDSVIVEPHVRKKRPCSKLGNKCKYGKNNRCIQAIENGEVISLIEKLSAR